MLRPTPVDPSAGVCRIGAKGDDFFRFAGAGDSASAFYNGRLAVLRAAVAIVCADLFS